MNRSSGTRGHPDSTPSSSRRSGNNHQGSLTSKLHKLQRARESFASLGDDHSKVGARLKRWNVIPSVTLPTAAQTAKASGLSSRFLQSSSSDDRVVYVVVDDEARSGVGSVRPVSSPWEEEASPRKVTCMLSRHESPMLRNQNRTATNVGPIGIGVGKVPSRKGKEEEAEQFFDPSIASHALDGDHERHRNSRHNVLPPRKLPPKPTARTRLEGSPATSPVVGVCGSKRLFGLGSRPPPSLLQSARVQQSKIMEVGAVMHQSVSLDHGDEQGEGTSRKPLLSLLQSARKQQSKILQVGHVIHGAVSREHEGGSTDDDSETEDGDWVLDMNVPAMMTSVDSSTEVLSSSIAAASSGSTPTLAPTVDDHAEELMDSLDSEQLRSTLATDDDEATLYQRRCRDLLRQRQEHWRREDETPLLSSGGSKRLAQVPSLLKIGDDIVLRELARRGRRLVREQVDTRPLNLAAAATHASLEIHGLANIPDGSMKRAVEPFFLPISKRRCDIYGRPRREQRENNFEGRGETGTCDGGSENYLVLLCNLLQVPQPEECSIDQESRCPYGVTMKRRIALNLFAFCFAVLWLSRCLFLFRDYATKMSAEQWLTRHPTSAPGNASALVYPGPFKFIPGLTYPVMPSLLFQQNRDESLFPIVFPTSLHSASQCWKNASRIIDTSQQTQPAQPNSRQVHHRTDDDDVIATSTSQLQQYTNQYVAQPSTSDKEDFMDVPLYQLFGDMLRAQQRKFRFRRGMRGTRASRR